MSEEKGIDLSFSHLAEFSEDDTELLIVSVPAEAILSTVLLNLTACHLRCHSDLRRFRRQPGNKENISLKLRNVATNVISGIQLLCVTVSMDLNGSIKGFLSSTDFTLR